MKAIYEIKQTDIGRRFITDRHGKLVLLVDTLGYVLPCDVGKRLYRIVHNGRMYCPRDRVVSVENNEQLARRIKHEV